MKTTYLVYKRIDGAQRRRDAGGVGRHYEGKQRFVYGTAALFYKRLLLR